MNPVILFRGRGPAVEAELAAAQKYFNVVDHRAAVPTDSLCIGRYSVLPFYRELELDLAEHDSRLINSTLQHQYIADLQNWYQDLSENTPETWFRIEDIPENEQGPFVLKGETNSKKELWSTHFYAKDRAALMDVLHKLHNDSLIGSQRIYVRKFERFQTICTDDISGQPITHEYRTFVANGKILSSAYYWQSHSDYLVESSLISKDAIQDPLGLYPDLGGFVEARISEIGDNATAYAIDVALHEDGRWRVVELNDLQMSGLSCNDPEAFYSALQKSVT